LPCTLWFFDKGKVKTNRKNQTLFLDVREVYYQVDRAHREFTEAHIEFVANIVKLYRGDEPSFEFCDKEQFLEQFPKLKYQNISGLCKIASIEEIEKQSWSLNAGRYVGAADAAVEDYVFEEKLKELNDELEALNFESKNLENKINHNINQIIKSL
jgi:type I restriction enzyme M protein